MDKQTQAVAEAIWNETWFIMKPQYMEGRTPMKWEDAPDFEKENFCRYARGAIKASGAEHLGELVKAKDAEIAELNHDVEERLNIITWQWREIDELRGLLGEAQSALDWFIVGELTKVKAFEIIDRATTALAGKEQPK